MNGKRAKQLRKLPGDKTHHRRLKKAYALGAIKIKKKNA